jgi:hypothetical protein
MPSLLNKLKMAYLQHHERAELASATQGKHYKNSVITVSSPCRMSEEVVCKAVDYLDTNSHKLPAAFDNDNFLNPWGGGGVVLRVLYCTSCQFYIDVFAFYIEFVIIY